MKSRRVIPWWKMVEVAVTIRGKCHGHPRKLHGNSTEIYAEIAMEISMEIHEIPRNVVEFCGLPWNSHGFPRSFPVVYVVAGFDIISSFSQRRP